MQGLLCHLPTRFWPQWGSWFPRFRELYIKLSNTHSVHVIPQVDAFCFIPISEQGWLKLSDVTIGSQTSLSIKIMSCRSTVCVISLWTCTPGCCFSWSHHPVKIICLQLMGQRKDNYLASFCLFLYIYGDRTTTYTHRGRFLKVNFVKQINKSWTTGPGVHFITCYSIHWEIYPVVADLKNLAWLVKLFITWSQPHNSGCSKVQL